MKMKREEAIRRLTDIVRCMPHNTENDMRNDMAVRMAITDMEYCNEVDKYGSELAMMVAKHEEDLKNRCDRCGLNAGEKGLYDREGERVCWWCMKREEIAQELREEDETCNGGDGE